MLKPTEGSLKNVFYLVRYLFLFLFHNEFSESKIFCNIEKLRSSMATRSVHSAYDGES
jgi:hypothetical protein